MDQNSLPLEELARLRHVVRKESKNNDIQAKIRLLKTTDNQRKTKIKTEAKALSRHEVDNSRSSLPHGCVAKSRVAIDPRFVKDVPTNCPEDSWKFLENMRQNELQLARRVLKKKPERRGLSNAETEALNKHMQRLISYNDCERQRRAKEIKKKQVKK